MTTTETTTLDRLTILSLKQHSNMLALLRPLEMQLEASTLESVTRFNTLFSSLQQQIKTTDAKLIEQLKTTAVPENITPLLGRRQALQKEILQMLRHAIPRAASVKSVMASEIQLVKKGRKALNGYKTMSDRQGGIVNRTS